MTEQSIQFIEIAKSLPIEMRLEIVDSLLESINPTNPTIDELWKPIIRRRVEDIKSGRVKPIPGDVVKAKIAARYEK